MNVNKAIILGRAGSKPELRAMPSGASIATLNLATTRTYKDKDGNKQEQTQWHNVVLYGKLADIAAQYIDKGQLVYIEGRMQTDKYEKKDGSTGYAFKIIAEALQLGPRPGGVAPSVAKSDTTPGVKVEYPENDNDIYEDIDPDEIPF